MSALPQASGYGPVAGGRTAAATGSAGRCQAAAMFPFDSPRTVDGTDEVRLALYDLGGSGPDGLLVHATGFCAGVWGPMAAHLPDLRLGALDVRGHGRSAVDGQWLERVGMDWHGTARDVLSAVEGLGLDRPFGIGHSMGGASLLLAEQQRPGTFSGLWLFEPIVFPPELVTATQEGRGPSLAEGARRRRDRFPSADDALVNYAHKPPLDALAPAALEAYVRHGFSEQADGSVVLRCRPEVEAATFEMGGRHDAWDHLPRVRCPVTVVRGRADGPGPAVLAPAIAERVPHGRLEEHPELGHFGPMEDPAAMATSVRAALGAGSGPAVGTPA
jgi:pimeloyl-ACP methyl ester carboxylesterase